MNLTDEKLLKKAILYLLDGNALNIPHRMGGDDGHLDLYYFRRGQIVESNSGDQFEVLEHGIFCLLENGLKEKRYFRFIALDEVDWFFKELTQEQKEAVYANMVFVLGMKRSRE
jgi:hypothetical protein